MLLMARCFHGKEQTMTRSLYRMQRRYRHFCVFSLAVLTMQLTQSAVAEGLVDTLVRRFSESEFEFVRAQSNAPFVPLAWVDARSYQQSSFGQVDGFDSDVTFEQTSLSQSALLPIPLGERDAIAIGEWISWTHFDLQNARRDELEVLSVSVPVGWIRQASSNWQLAAFVAPLGHKTPEDSWYWETLGGFFARNVRGDRFAWIIGAYFDVSPLEDFYTPYLGAVYIVNERWTLNGVMPWPSVTYAPTRNTMFRFGVAPSGASWSVEPGEERPRFNLSTWDVGLSIEHRLFSNVWAGFEIGASCLRGLSLVGTQWEAPETKLDRTGFARLTINLRPQSRASSE